MKTINKSLIKTGDIGCCIGVSTLSKTIQKATDSIFSHTTQFIWVDGVLFVIEAQAEGVVMYSYETWQRKYNYDFIIFRNPSCLPEERWRKNAMQYLGVKYDKKGLAVGLFASLLKRTDMHDKYRNNGMFWCSELTAKLALIQFPEDYSPKLIGEYGFKNYETILKTY
jgi:hypothetical protein